MPHFLNSDGTDLYYKDWGHVQTIVFNHAYGLNADAFEDQMFFLAKRGCRCVAPARRGHGRSGQTWHGNDIDTYADDLAQLMEHLDLKEVTLVSHSTGGAVVARYIGRYGESRVDRVVLIASVTPSLLKTPEHPTVTPIEVFDGFREGVLHNRAQFMKDLAVILFRSGSAGRQHLRSPAPVQLEPGYDDGLPAAYFAIKAFSETDTTEDLKKINVPTLLLHGDVDKIVPIGNAHRTARLIPNAILEGYPGAPHAMIATAKNQVNEDLSKGLNEFQGP